MQSSKSPEKNEEKQTKQLAMPAAPPLSVMVGVLALMSFITFIVSIVAIVKLGNYCGENKTGWIVAIVILGISMPNPIGLILACLVIAGVNQSKLGNNNLLMSLGVGRKLQF